MTEQPSAASLARRAESSPALFAALQERYGLRARDSTDLGGSFNLNVLVTDEMPKNIVCSLAVVRDLERWQAAFA